MPLNNLPWKTRKGNNVRKKIVYLLPVLIVIAGVVAMWFLSSFKTAPGKKKPEPVIKIVETRSVELDDIPAEIVAYGRLASSQPVILYSEVDGTLQRGDLNFRPGQSFKQGTLLLKIDTRQITLDINTAKSDLLNALASVLPEIKLDFPEKFPVWQDYFNSCRFDKKIPDLPAAANQKIKLYLSRFNVYKIYFTIRALEILYEKHFFYAPFKGSIVSADLRVGSNARPGTRLGEIINLENLEAEMPVPAEDIRWIDRSKPVTLTSSEIEGTWTGTIRRIGKTIDTRTQAVQIYIEVDQSGDENLYDGVFLKATIPGLTIPHACIVPREALYEQQFVYVVEDDKLSYRSVQVTRRQPDYVIVNDGLTDGDLLVVEMLQGVTPGMLARPKQHIREDES
jgi:multidrug efflux pump subunit AcrA (membrane-fusion protein)